MIRFGLSVVCLCLALSARAEDPPLQTLVGDAVKVEYGAVVQTPDGEKDQRQYFPQLRTTVLPTYDTRIIFSEAGLIPTGAQYRMLVMPGSSAKCDGELGLLPSMSPFTNLYRRAKGAPFAFQPPIYTMAHDPEARKPFLTKYKGLEENLHWFRRIFAAVDAVEIPKPVAGSKPPRLTPWYGTFRSTTAGWFLEMYHRAAKGDRRFAFIRKFKRVLLMSVDGHTEEAIDYWHPGEIEYLLEKSNKGDEPVLMAAPDMFREMRWQTEFLAHDVDAAELGPLPPLMVVFGSRDEIAKGDMRPLMQPMVDFAKKHPFAHVQLGWHPGFHDPGKTVVEGGRVIYRAMQLTKLITSYVLGPDFAPPPGLSVRYFPDHKAVFAPLQRSDVLLCGPLLAGTAAYENFPPPEPPPPPPFQGIVVSRSRHMNEPDLGDDFIILK